MSRTKPPEDAAQAAAPVAPCSLAPGDRLIEGSEVETITAESKTTRYERIAAGLHPAPFKDGRKSLYLLSEVLAYAGAKVARLPRKAGNEAGRD